MVRKCQVCGKMDYLSPEVSFHKFPTNPEKRREWFAAMGLDENKVSSKNPEICSDHFNAGDIINRANGLKYIVRGAKPTPNANIFFEESSTSSVATLDELNNLPPTEQTCVLPSTSASYRNQDVLNELCEYELYQMSQESSSDFSSYSPRPGPPRVLFTEQRKDSALVTENSSGSFDSVSDNEVTKQKEEKTLKRKKIHHLQMTVRRLKMRITNLTSLIDYLKEKALISEDFDSTIRASLSGPAVDIFERMLKEPRTHKYNESLRSFALTLSFYSARAYNFVRKTFNKTLPHLATISKWYKSVDENQDLHMKRLQH